MLKNIAKNFSSLIVSQVIYKLLSFLAIAYAARHIGDAAFGQLSFALYFGILFFAMSDIGMSEVYILEAAGNRQNEKKSMGICIGNRIIFSAAAFILLYACAFFLSNSRDLFFLIFLIGAAMIIDSATFFLRSVFRAREQMEYEAVSIILEGAVKLFAIAAALIIFKNSLFFLGVAFLLSSTASFLITALICKNNFLLVKPVFKLDHFLSFSKRGLPFAVIGFLSVVSLKIDTIMLAKMSGDYIAGWYGAAVRLLEAILIIPITSATVLFPVVSRLYNKSVKSFLKVYKVSLMASFVVGVFLAAAMYFGAGLMINIVFGKAFLNSVYIFRVLSLIVIPIFLRLLLERTAMAAGKTGVLLLAYIVAVAFKIALNIVFIPILNYTGAAFTTIFIEFGVCAFILIRLDVWFKKITFHLIPDGIMDNIAFLHEKE